MVVLVIQKYKNKSDEKFFSSDLFRVNIIFENRYIHIVHRQNENILLNDDNLCRIHYNEPGSDNSKVTHFVYSFSPVPIQ